MLMVDSVVTGLFVPLSLLYLSASTGASLVRVGTLLSVAGLVSLPLLFSLLLDMSSAAPRITPAALALATVPGMLALAPRLPHAASATGAAGRSAA
ncbi:hypothetical protein ACFV2H_20815 [Streptomyces sp. NPDC059629]|uniref:hypothetical protein n=1 Tax=Streptomyces sp. NPDC059629 TaxID=3346889 RepID=UPI003688B49E